MKLRLLQVIAITLAPFALASLCFAGMPVKSLTRIVFDFSRECDYTPGKSDGLSPRSCGYRAYQKLLGIAQKITPHDNDSFGGKGYLNLKVSDADGGTIGEISVVASEAGTSNSDLFGNGDRGSDSGVACNVKGVTSVCYHDNLQISRSLPTPEAQNTDANCNAILNQITEYTVSRLVGNYHRPSDARMEGQRTPAKPRSVPDGTQYQQFKTGEPGAPATATGLHE